MIPTFNVVVSAESDDELEDELPHAVRTPIDKVAAAKLNNFFNFIKYISLKLELYLS